MGHTIEPLLFGLRDVKGNTRSPAKHTTISNRYRIVRACRSRAQSEGEFL